MRKLDLLKSSAPKGTFIDFTTVWNVHNTDLLKLVNNKRSNLWEVLSWNKGLLTEGVTLIVGAKGRSQHSESELLVFKGDQRRYLGGKGVFIENHKLDVLK